MLEVGELLQCGLQLLVGAVVILLHLHQLVLQASHRHLAVDAASAAALNLRFRSLFLLEFFLMLTSHSLLSSSPLSASPPAWPSRLPAIMDGGAEQDFNLSRIDQDFYAWSSNQTRSPVLQQ